jgi:hypothetical protein
MTQDEYLKLILAPWVVAVCADGRQLGVRSDSCPQTLAKTLTKFVKSASE